MNTRSAKILSLLNIPKYESTKGLGEDLKNKAIKEFQKLPPDISTQTDDGVSASDSESKTSGSEYVPSDTDESIVSNTTDESCKPLASIKLDKGNQSRKTNDIKKTKKARATPHRNYNIPDSTIFESSTSSASATNNNVHIMAAVKCNGKRIRNKGHACYFCQKVVLNPSRHFEVMHKTETEVAKILAMPKNSKNRRESFSNLIRVGDFYHNCEVMSMKKGELILVRRPTEDEHRIANFNYYGPCPNCLGFMLKKLIWHHIKFSRTSKTRVNTGKSRHIIAESNAILNNAFGAEFSTDFITNIASKLRDDDIGNYCKEDNLILKFGALQFEKYGTTQCELIRQMMRQLARFAMKAREIENSNKHLSDYLEPQMFDLVIQATKSVCVSHQNIVKRPEFEIPSLALKIGHALKKCASIQRGSCLRAGNLSGNNTLMCFLNLMELEWCARISSNALATVYNRKMNATQLLPLTSDLLKLSQHIDHEMTKVRALLAESCTTQNWTYFASLILSKVILFNKRRSGEASRMTISNYASRPMWSEQCTEELKNSLTELEKKLAEQLTVIEIIGKRGRKVPVLLTQDTKLSVDLLIKTRQEVDISKENPYVFARSGNSISNLRGHDCLRKICSDAYLEHAENITSTKLRKYIATVCQVFNLSENEYDWLARHLGHDVRVHRQFYRLHESAVELTKVSRLLLAVDKGEVSKYAGKKLEDINLEDLPPPEEDQEEMEDENVHNEDVPEMSAEPVPTGAHNKDIRESLLINDPTVSSSAEINITTNNRRQVCSASVPSDKQKEKTGRSCQKRPWSTDEKEAVLKFFKASIKKESVPGKADCSRCIEENAILISRKWTDIKFCVKNHIDKIKKMRK